MKKIIILFAILLVLLTGCDSLFDAPKFTIINEEIVLGEDFWSGEDTLEYNEKRETYSGDEERFSFYYENSKIPTIHFEYQSSDPIVSTQWHSFQAHLGDANVTLTLDLPSPWWYYTTPNGYGLYRYEEELQITEAEKVLLFADTNITVKLLNNKESKRRYNRTYIIPSEFSQKLREAFR